MATTKRLFPTLFLPLALSLGVFTATGLVGCSTNSADQAGENADAVPPPDAGTDAVPQAAAEDGAPPTAPVADASAPPADGSTPPADVASADTAPVAAPPPESSTPPPADAAAAPAPAMDAPPAAPVAAAPSAPTPDASAPVAAPAQASAPTLAASSGSTGGMTEDYTVQRGDTLMKIAFETYGDLYKWKDIYEGNHDRISNPNAVPPGTVLKLNKPAVPVALERNGDQYLIKTGDTLGTISTDVYGVKSKWKKLWENNKQLIKDPNKIYAGFYLFYTLTPSERENFNNRKSGAVAPQPLAQDEAPAAEEQPQANAAPAAPAPAVAQPVAAAPQAPVAPTEVRDPASVKPLGESAKK